MYVCCIICWICYNNNFWPLLRTPCVLPLVPLMLISGNYGLEDDACSLIIVISKYQIKFILNVLNKLLKQIC